MQEPPQYVLEPAERNPSPSSGGLEDGVIGHPVPAGRWCDAACVVVIQFKHGRASHFSCGHSLNPGAHVIVEGDRGEDLGMVIATRSYTHADTTLPRVVRDASQSEAEWWRCGLAEEEKEAKILCQEIVGRRNIPIKIMHAEFQFDMRKLTFHYASDDAQATFRDCLGDCYAVWKCRIWFTRVSERGLRRVVVRRQQPRVTYTPAPQACGPSGYDEYTYPSPDAVPAGDYGCPTPDGDWAPTHNEYSDATATGWNTWEPEQVHQSPYPYSQ